MYIYCLYIYMRTTIRRSAAWPSTARPRLRPQRHRACLSIYLSVCLSVCLSIYIYIYIICMRPKPAGAGIARTHARAHAHTHKSTAHTHTIGAGRARWPAVGRAAARGYPSRELFARAGGWPAGSGPASGRCLAPRDAARPVSPLRAREPRGPGPGVGGPQVEARRPGPGALPDGGCACCQGRGVRRHCCQGRGPCAPSRSRRPAARRRAARLPVQAQCSTPVDGALHAVVTAATCTNDFCRHDSDVAAGRPSRHRDRA